MKTLILSDIHLGNGAGYDIFAGGAALPDCLDFHSEQGPIRVLLNGDTADFLMNRDELVLRPELAERQAREIVAAPDSAAVLRALGRVLARGGEIIARLGNHDVELALPGVQAIFREALGQPEAVAAGMRFVTGERPEVLEIGGARLLVTHGEHCDPWNRIDYGALLGGGYESFRYPPGSRLVKTVLNPLKIDYQMRFADMLKPDFQGAVLTALAVNPGAVKAIFQASTLSLSWQLFRRRRGALTFGLEEELEPETGLADRLDEVALSEAEQEAVEVLLDEGPSFFSAADDPALDGAMLKFFRGGMRLYSRAQRALVRDAGERYFDLAPGEAEWAEARRLADKFDASAVIVGHTHAARWGQEGALCYVNTGTWIRLMGPPPARADEGEWERFLHMLKRNPMLDPERGEAPPLITRFTGAVIEEHPAGGASLRLVEWTDEGAVRLLGEGRVPPRSQLSR